MGLNWQMMVAFYPASLQKKQLATLGTLTADRRGADRAIETLLTPAAALAFYRPGAFYPCVPQLQQSSRDQSGAGRFSR